MIQSLVFNILYFMFALMHRILAKVQGLRAFRKQEQFELRLQGEMCVGRGVSHQLSMPLSKLFRLALCVHHAFLKEVIPSVDRSHYFKLKVLIRFSSRVKAPGWRYKSHDMHRYDVMTWLKYRCEVLLWIWR